MSAARPEVMSAARVCHFKLVLLGDTAVGKSCLVVRFVRDEFFEFQEPTIGGTPPFVAGVYFSLLAAFLTQSVATGAATVKFEIWDTAGQGETGNFVSYSSLVLP